MINPYTLKFINDHEEMDYGKFILKRTKKELLNYSIFVSVYCLIRLYEFAHNGMYYFSILSVMTILIQIGNYFLVAKIPSLIDYVLSFFQFFIAVAFNSNHYLNSDQKVDETFAWYYGFQCSFFHIVLYLQGNHFIGQSIVLLLVFIIHLQAGQKLVLEALVNNITFFWVYISLLTMRYSFDNSKRSSYILYKQQKNIYRIMEDANQLWSILLKLDEKQDQLVSVQCNKTLMKKFQLWDNHLIRMFMRQIFLIDQSNYVKKSDKKSNNLDKIQASSKTLEVVVREQLNSCSQNGNLQSTKQYLGRMDTKITNINIRVMICYVNQQQMALIVFEQNSNRKKIHKLKKQLEFICLLIQDTQRALYDTISSNLGIMVKIYFSILQYQFKINNLFERNMRKTLIQINNLKNLQLISEINRDIQNYNEIIEIKMLRSYLILLFPKMKINRIVFDKVGSIRNNKQYFLQLIISTIQVFIKSEDEFEISFNRQNSGYIEVTMKICNLIEIPTTIIRYLRSNIFRSVKNDLSCQSYTKKNQLQKECLELFHKLVNNSIRMGMDDILNLVCIKFLIAQLGPYNSIEIEVNGPYHHIKLLLNDHDQKKPPSLKIKNYDTKTKIFVSSPKSSHRRLLSFD